MPRKRLRRWLPSPARVRSMQSLRVLGEWIYQPNLWHINRYSASMGMFTGLFVAFLPLPGQMPLAALLAVLLRCNLPLSVALVWVTNPVTMPAIFYLAYRVGALLIDSHVPLPAFEMSLSWLESRLHTIWQPLLLGSVLCGLLVGSLGYFVVNLLWRIHVIHHWRQRRQRRAQRSAASVEKDRDAQ